MLTFISGTWFCWFLVVPSGMFYFVVMSPVRPSLRFV